MPAFKMLNSTFNRYILFRIISPFLLALFIILAALSLERLLRLIDIVSAENAPFSYALSLLIYLQPHYLGLAIPAAMFLSIILAVRNLSENSELVVMQAAGISYTKLLFPVLSLALLLTFAMFLITGFGQPYGRYHYRAAVQDIKTSGEVLRIQPQEFIKLGEKTTLRVDAVEKRGSLLNGFFVEDIGEDGSKTIATSQQAEIITPDQTTTHAGELNLTLTNARILSIDPSGKSNTITTQSYPLSLSSGPSRTYGARGQERRELTYGELISGGARNVIPEDTDSELRAEFHLRAVQTLSLPVLAVLAIALGLIGSGRTGKATGLILGVILLVLYQKSLGFAESFASHGAIPAWLALWGPWFILITGTAVFFAYTAGLLFKKSKGTSDKPKKKVAR